MKCARCSQAIDVPTKVTLGKPDAEWADIMEWTLCSMCAGGIMVYIIDEVPLDYAAADGVDYG